MFNILTLWRRHLSYIVLMLAVLVKSAGAEGPTPTPPPPLLADAGDAMLEEALEGAALSRDPSRWFILMAAVNVYPKLESEELIREYFDPIMKFLSPGYDPVTIISDLRDDHLLWPPHFGIGYQFNNHLAGFIQGGYSAGKVRTKQNDPSIVLLPLHTDFEIKRGAGFVGLGLDYFPFGMPVRRDYKNWKERILAARPSLGTRATWTHAFFKAKVKVGLKPLMPHLNLELEDSWDLWSANFNGGLDVPLTRRSVLTLNGGYNYFEGETGDFNSSSFTVGWKYFFR